MPAIARIVATLALAATAAASAQSYRQVAQWDLHASGGFDYLLASSSDHRLYVAQSTQIIVVDTRTGAIAGNITGLQHAHGVALDPATKTGYITDGGANKILLFDIPSLKLTGEIPTGGDNPDSLVLDPASGLLFTFNGKSRQGVAIDLHQRKVVASFPVPGKPEFSQADGHGHVFVNVETTSQLLRIDTASRKVTATWKLTGCEGPSGLAYDAAHGRLFSVCDGKMAVTDAATGHQVALVPIGDGPDAVWYDAKRSLIFASNGGPGTLSIISLDSPDKYTVRQTIKTSPGARTMALDDSTGTAYVIAPLSPAGQPSTAPRQLKIDVIAP